MIHGLVRLGVFLYSLVFPFISEREDSMVEQGASHVGPSSTEPEAIQVAVERMQAISREWARMCLVSGQAVTLNQATQSIDQKQTSTL